MYEKQINPLYSQDQGREKITGKNQNISKVFSTNKRIVFFYSLT